MMADVKRNISEVSSGSSNLSHDDKKLHTKPGRKPIEIEPKSKRTAQNRAAQRAYRERKERKMKDLEDKVKSLEDETIKANTELDFLKAQVDMLKNELARYRGHTDFLDLKLPTRAGHLSNPNTGGTYRPTMGEKHHSSQSDSASNKSSVGEVKFQSPNESLNNTSPDSVGQFSASFPWSKDNLADSNTSNDGYLTGQKQYVPDLISGSSSSTSPLNDNILVSPDSQNSAPNTVNSNQFDNQNDQNYGFTHQTFEEQVDPFCVKLNEACGTKDCPVPKDKEDQYQYNSPFSNLRNPEKENYTTSTNDNTSFDPFFNGDSKFNFELSSNNEDPLSFLNDNNFDVSLAFADSYTEPKRSNEVDPMSLLTTEESVYDPLNDKGFNFNDFVRTSVSDGHEDNSVKKTNTESAPQKTEEEEVVPAPEDTVKCSEIWDRITSHPKYTELDIDGLCNELKSKAKCSETGVVINSSDVNHLLEQSALLRRK